jgi:UDP-perosamine 4-acetyltransferase
VTPQKIIGLGAGGHAKVVIDVLRATAAMEIIGLLDPRADLHGSTVAGVPVIGDDSLVPTLAAYGVSAAFIGVGGVGSTRTRRSLYELARRHALDVVPAIHDRAIVSALASIGHGPTIFAGAIVNAAAVLGANVLINTGAVVEHDVVLGSHVHVSSGACLGGGVTVEQSAFIGMGAVVRQGIKVGAFALVGAGAVVVDDVPERAVVVGVPARMIRTVEDV